MPRRLQRVAGGLNGAPLDKVRDDVQPLAVPAEHAAPHLVGLVGLDLAAEAAVDGAEHDGQAAGVRPVVCGPDAGEALLEEGEEQVRARDVQVRVVGCVGLVHVVVDFEQWCVRSRNEGLEDHGAIPVGREFLRAGIEMLHKSVEDAHLNGERDDLSVLMFFHAFQKFPSVVARKEGTYMPHHGQCFEIE